MFLVGNVRNLAGLLSINIYSYAHQVVVHDISDVMPLSVIVEFVLTLIKRILVVVFTEKTYKRV